MLSHFISENPLGKIETFFDQNIKCAVIAFRIFWSKNDLVSSQHNMEPHRVKGFVGCGHVWRMEAWKQIPNYPEWFVFYGEEDFASYHLFKKKWEIHYIPDVLIQHRVDVKNRKIQKDYLVRLRRSLRSGWYLYFLFYPISKIPRKMAYSIWIQLKLKVFKGDVKALAALLGALVNLIVNIPRLLYFRNPLNKEEYRDYNMLNDTVIYWTPKNK